MAYTERQAGPALLDFWGENAQALSIAAFFVGCCVLFGLLTPTFLTAGNLLNVVRQAAPVLIVAVAMTLVIVTGGIDLAVGSLVALANALVAILLAQGWGWVEATAAILLGGAALGLIQGWLIAFQGIPAFIVTLAGLSIFRGWALWQTEGYSIPVTGVPGFLWLGRGTLGGVPVPALLALAAAALGLVVMAATRYGRRVVAVGSNAEAARRAGMPARAVVASVYVVSGVASAVAGLLLAARLGSGSSNAAVGFELQVIAGVVLGGTSLMGGRGSMVGTVLGTLTIAVIANGLILVKVSPFLTQIVTGAIILLAVWLNARLFGMRLPRRRA